MKINNLTKKLYQKSKIYRVISDYGLYIISIIPYKFAYIKALITNRNMKIILFYPEKPKYFHVLYKICHILGYKITNNLYAKTDTVIYFEDTTFKQKAKTLELLIKKEKVVNINCLDISKENVDKIFSTVFNYSAMVNPLTYIGKCVEKSNINAKHDGKVIQCPTNPKNGYVYQKIINNQYNNIIKDIRVPIINNKIPFIYLKYRNINNRFSNTNERAEIKQVDKILSQDERDKVLLFCKEIGLDYGELDILRDRNDKKLYIIDVNNTPAGPPNHISKNQYKKALSLLSSELKLNYFNTSF